VRSAAWSRIFVQEGKPCFTEISAVFVCEEIPRGLVSPTFISLYHFIVLRQLTANESCERRSETNWSTSSNLLVLRLFN
jgi:hypothetical protein